MDESGREEPDAAPPPEEEEEGLEDEEEEGEDVDFEGLLEDLGVQVPIMEPGAEAESNSEETNEQFDMSLPATHSYLSSGLVAVQGRSVLEAGWQGRVPCVGHHSVVYPGETVPMVMSNPRDCDILNAAIQSDRLFGLLFAVSFEAGQHVSGYGVLCEVYEATMPNQHWRSLAFKARARQRFRLLRAPRDQSLQDFTRVKMLEIIILPEVTMGNPLYNSRLSSLDSMRSTASKQKLAKIKQMDAIVTNWPVFVFENYDYNNISKVIHKYFSGLKFESLPTDMTSLSFWAASNLPLSYKDRMDLFREDNALQRLRMEVNFIEEYYILCCQGCGELNRTQIARREDIFAMSSEGMKSNYCNLGGYVHDIMTVSQIYNVQTSGLPSAEFSWFPGYLWTILVCTYCDSHIGWKFTATKRSFYLQTFYAICRNYVYPCAPPLPDGYEQPT